MPPARIGGVVKHEAVATQAMFDRRFGRYYWLVLSVAMVVCLSAFLRGYRFDPNLLMVFPPFLFIWAGGLLARRIGLNRIAASMEVIALLYLQSLLALISIGLLAALSAPYADARLSAWDRSLGLDWPAWFDLSRPIARPLIFAYASFNWQPIVIIAALVLTGRERRLYTWLTAALIGVLVCAAVFVFFPAQSPYHFYGLSPVDFPERPNGSLWTFVEGLAYYKDGGRILGPKLLTGMVAFPSYHAVAALLFTWAAWPTVARWPILTLNVLMLVSIPTIGNHYFIDVLAGLAVGTGVLLLCDFGCRDGALADAAKRVVAREQARCASKRGTVASMKRLD